MAEISPLTEPLRQRVSKWAQIASKSKKSTPTSSTSSYNGPKRSKETEKSVSKFLMKVHARHLDAAKADILRVLRLYHGLAPDVANFVHDNGDERRLMILAGTIPVDYHAETYNIPVCIWIRNDHPTSPPMVYVTPTPDMRIKASRFVEQNGKVILPYLDTEWKYPDSNLTGLVQVCRSAFGEIPPVFAKSRRRSHHKSTNSQSSSPQQNSSSDSPSFTNEIPHSQEPAASSDQMSPSDNVTEEELRTCLVSEVEDAFKWRLEEEESKTKAELESLSLVHQELLDNQEEIEKIEALLDAKMSETRDSNEKWKGCIEEMEELCEAYDKIDLTDETVQVSGGPLQRQIMRIYAEDLAYSDALYWLGEGFKAGNIPCEPYFKKVRDLARKQFYARFLLEKCREKAGIADENIGNT